MTEKPLPKDNFEFKEELRVAINRNSIDAQVALPDYILADLIAGLLSEPSFIDHFRSAVHMKASPIPSGVKEMFRNEPEYRRSPLAGAPEHDPEGRS